MSVCLLGRCSLSESEIKPPSVVDTFRVFCPEMEICRQKPLRGVRVHILCSHFVCRIQKRKWKKTAAEVRVTALLCPGPRPGQESVGLSRIFP